MPHSVFIIQQSSSVLTEAKVKLHPCSHITTEVTSCVTVLPLQLSKDVLPERNTKKELCTRTKLTYQCLHVLLKQRVTQLLVCVCVCLCVCCRQVSGNSNNNPCQPCNSQRCLCPQRGQRLVLRQWDATWCTAVRMQRYRKTTLWKHSQHWCESWNIYSNLQLIIMWRVTTRQRSYCCNFIKLLLSVILVACTIRQQIPCWASVFFHLKEHQHLIYNMI